MMGTIISGLILGAGFGWVLERAGFGSPCKLTAQFRLTDWSVFKVMFTAIVFAAVGLMLLEGVGIVQGDELFIPPAFLGAAALGGALVGAGFAIGGYCPGTSLVGFVSGRLDAALFLIGLILGTWGFAWAFPQIEFLTSLGELNSVNTLPELIHVSPLYVNAALILMAIGVFLMGGWMERKSSGPISSQDAMNGCAQKN
ncbi:YeeE/YedE thiosulfate transporter family protein [Polynucleobacter sp. MWH-UH24A]|uniref:YeeE/YedE thiosulfate transporter family protein n=1 Tax=Polynucleobacter sp. MWH-UH24A TaxID=2689110 RepID=UPI001BFDC985|nr:YeeE/YedE thiosulfate transporter family protein [Polynucleobacter sp. MWH-UH24A]